MPVDALILDELFPPPIKLEGGIRKHALRAFRIGLMVEKVNGALFPDGEKMLEIVKITPEGRLLLGAGLRMYTPDFVRLVGDPIEAAPKSLRREGDR